MANPTCEHCGAPLDRAGAANHRCPSAVAEAPQEHTVVYLVAPGDILDDRWRIDRRIGHGAMGSVFSGTDLEKNRAVAIKLLSPEHCRKPKVLARFEREARLMTTLRHPNIVQLHGVGRRGALPYIVMQYLEGHTLSDYLKQRADGLTPGEMLAIVRQVCSGLSFVHHHGLVHRDIKPQNIFIGPQGHVTILDLGVVRDRSDPGLTKPGAMVGTPFYMAPEQILGTSEVDRRTDVYALGAVIYEILIGSPPFLGESNFEVLYAHRTKPPPDASAQSKAIPKMVGMVLMRAMAKQPEDRPQNVHELLTELEVAYNLDRAKAPNSALAPVLPSPSEVATRPPRMAPRRLAGAKPVPSAPRRSLSAEAPHATPRNDSVVEVSSVDIVELEDDNTVPFFGDERLLPDDPASTKDAPADSADDEDERKATKDTSASADDETAADATNTATGTAEGHATVIEHGELRVVTTLRGLTTGAAVFIDQQPQGNTPLSTRLPAGVHLVRVERPTYKTVEREAHVVANQVTLVRVELEPARPPPSRRKP